MPFGIIFYIFQTKFQATKTVVYLCLCFVLLHLAVIFTTVSKLDHATNIHAIHAYTQCGEAECVERLNNSVLK